MTLNWYPKSDLPFDPQHDRSILAIDVDRTGDIMVTASADHALHVYNTWSGKRTKNLYNKRLGHTDWVTTCAIL